jgi:hypothetical protein
MINRKDISEIYTVGKLRGSDVRLIKTKGGFHIFMGKEKPDTEDKILASSSHRAIGLHQIEQQYPDFQPAIMKSESEEMEQVKDVSSRLGSLAKNLGYQAYILHKNDNFRISISKDSFEVGSVSLGKKENDLEITNIQLPIKGNRLLKEELSQSLANIVEDLSSGK